MTTRIYPAINFKQVISRLNVIGEYNEDNISSRFPEKFLKKSVNGGHINLFSVIVNSYLLARVLEFTKLTDLIKLIERSGDRTMINVAIFLERHNHKQYAHRYPEDNLNIQSYREDHSTLISALRVRIQSRVARKLTPWEEGKKMKFNTLLTRLTLEMQYFKIQVPHSGIRNQILFLSNNREYIELRWILRECRDWQMIELSEELKMNFYRIQLID